MKILIAGASGVLGRRLVRRLVERGHSVVGLARSDRAVETVRSLGGIPARADLFDPEALARAAEGADVIVHAATAIPTTDRERPDAWVMNDRIRREGTRVLTAAATMVGARRYLQQSIVWVVRTPDGSPYTEETPPNPSPLLRSAVDGEDIAREAGSRGGFTVGVIRCGGFYAADAAHTRMLAQGLLARRLPIVGRGDAVWAWIHADDAAAAFAAAAEGSASGLWHVVDDRPSAAGDILRTFAHLLGAPAPRRIPVWLARLVAGRGAADHFTTSMRTTNERFRRDFEWAPRYPTYGEGLPEVVERWRIDPTPPWSG